MTSRAVARRYARALFDVAVAERHDLHRAERELSDFAQLVWSHEGLHRALTNPVVPASRKRAVVEQLLAHAGAVLPPVGKLFLMLAERDRLMMLPDLVEAYRDRLMDHLQIVRADVTTAIPLPPDRLGRLQSSLAKLTGRQVQIETRVDAAILGGAVARLGSTVYDGSVTRQLEKLKEVLAGGAD